MKPLGVVVAAVVVLTIGCGDGDGPGCEFAGCGGDPTGSWSVDGVCGDFSALGSELQEQCAGLELDYDLSATGQIGINGDSSYRAVIQLRVNISASYPASCIADATSCADLQTGFEGAASCTGDVSDRCDCEFVSLENSDDSGTWDTDGAELRIVDGDSEGRARYCQDGDSLRLEMVGEDTGVPTAIYILSRN